jgi:hypothetical protein
MVASNGFGAVSYLVCRDDTGLELRDSMGEKRARIKPEGGALRCIRRGTLLLSHDKRCNISIDMPEWPTYTCARLLCLAAHAC